MSRKKTSRHAGERPARQRNTQTKDILPEASLVPSDLRTARPVRRLAGQVALHAESLAKRCATLEAWTHPKGEGEANPYVLEAHGALCHVVEGFPKFFEAMKSLDDLGFSPPRKSFTAGTEEGDSVTVLESFRSRYDDFMDPDLMVDLKVEKMYPGKSGGLIVVAHDGTKMKVAKCHVVRLS